MRYEETAKLKVFWKENDQKTAEVVQEQCMDEIVDAPVVVQGGVQNGLDEASDLKRRRRERLESGKDSRHRSVCGGLGFDVVGRIQVARDQEPGVEVGQKSSPGDPRSPESKANGSGGRTKSGRRLERTYEGRDQELDGNGVRERKDCTDLQWQEGAMGRPGRDARGKGG